MEKIFYVVILLGLAINAFLEAVYQLTYLNSKTEANLILNLVLMNITFIILGFLASIVSFSIYNTFTKKKEISTINFMLAPEKLKEEIRFFHNLIKIVFIGWSFYIGVAALSNNFPELVGKYERIFSVLYTSYILSSILLAIGVIVIFYKWRRRILSYA
jgi:heme/copper-type cytochrome/quinol oxidase subunit 2